MHPRLSRQSFIAGVALLSVPLISSAAFAQTSNTWTAKGAMITSRDAFSTLVVGSKVYAIGGRTNANGSTTRTTEAYNVPTSVFASAKSMTYDRSFFPAVPLSGTTKVLVIGGFSAFHGTIRPVEILNTATGAWTTTGSLLSARELFTATQLPNGQVLAAGGFSNNAILASAELYNPATGRWTYTKGAMSASRHGHTAILISAAPGNISGGKVLVMGGRTANNVSLCSTEVFDSAAGTWSAGPNMMQDRFRQTATVLNDGRILITGGYSSLAGNTLDTAEIYDPVLNTFTMLDSKMSATRMDHTATLLPDGRVLIVGGWSSTVQNPDGSFGSTVASADLFDPATNTFTPAAPLPSSRHEHTATLVALPNGLYGVLVAGGLHWEPSSHQTLRDAWLYTP